MRLSTIRNLILVLILIGGVSQSIAAENARIIRSLVFPGMGQLGDGQKVRGLVYMVGEVGLLTAVFEEVSRSYSYSRETEYYRAILDQPGDISASKQIEINNSWTDAKDKSNQARTLSMAFAGGAAVWWALNVIDGFLFAPKTTDDLSLKNINDHLVLSYNKQEARLAYKILF